MVFFSVSCKCQPASQFELTWTSPNPSSTYTVFVWQGANQDCPFVDGQDYKSVANNIEPYIVATDISSLSYVFNMDNDGEWAVGGVIANNQIYSGLAMSAYLNKKDAGALKPTLVELKYK